MKSFLLIILFYFSIPILADEPSADCPKFLSEIRFFKKTRIIYNFDSAGTEQIIQAATGVQASIKLRDAVTTIDGWLGKYKAYKEDLENFKKGLRRFDGEDPTYIKDALRIKGRLKIFEEALKQNAFPSDLVFPMAPEFDGTHIIVSRGGDLLTRWRFQNAGELKKFIRLDKKSSNRIEIAIIQREIEQAMLFIKIRQFLQRFPEDKVALASERVAYETTKKEGDIDILDLKSIQAAILRLVYEASKILKSSDQRFLDLRPTARSLSFIERITESDVLNGFVSKPHWLNNFKKHGGEVNSRVGDFLDFMSNYQKRLLLVASLSVIITQTTDVIHSAYNGIFVPTRDWIIYDSKEFEEKSEFDDFKELSRKVADKANDILEFDKNFLALYAQPNFDDEAVTIAFEYFAGIRKEPKADSLRDNKWNPEKLGGYTTQAKKISDVRKLLLEGTNNAYGTLVGAASRFAGRSYNRFLLEESAEHFYKSQGLPVPTELQKND